MATTDAAIAMRPTRRRGREVSSVMGRTPCVRTEVWSRPGVSERSRACKVLLRDVPTQAPGRPSHGDQAMYEGLRWQYEILRSSLGPHEARYQEQPDPFRTRDPADPVVAGTVHGPRNPRGPREGEGRRLHQRAQIPADHDGQGPRLPQRRPARTRL